MLKNNQSNPFHCTSNKAIIEKGIKPIKDGKAKILNLDKFREKKTSIKTKAKLVFSPWIKTSKVFLPSQNLTSKNWYT